LIDGSISILIYIASDLYTTVNLIVFYVKKWAFESVIILVLFVFV